MISSGRCHGPGCRAEAAIVEAAGRYTAGMATYERAVDSVLDDYARELAPANAAFPQVASNPDPTRGWLARLFDRLFGRTT